VSTPIPDPPERRHQPELEGLAPEDPGQVSHVMQRRPLAVPEGESVLRVCESMAESRIGQVLVVDAAWRPVSQLDLPPEPKGIFTERDLIRAFAQHHGKVLEMTVGQVMTSPVVSVAPDEELAHVADLMTLMRIRRMPVVQDGKTVGLLTRGRVMEAQARRLAEVERENQVLEERVVHDPLTGLANRVLFDRVLARELHRARDKGQQVSVLMLDLDFFKKVNDTHGHAVGDIVLRQLADVLRHTLRRADLPARVGGEEFAVVLTQGDASPQVVAEKVRVAVEREAFGEASEPLRLTISIGCASWMEWMKEPADLVKAADQSLYKAKGSGRNKVVAA
jgi:diguanylate cyclase (GGDEF)-like protein